MVQIVIDKKLLEATLVRDALREYLQRLVLLASEDQDHEGYSSHPQADPETKAWEAEAASPKE